MHAEVRSAEVHVDRVFQHPRSVRGGLAAGRNEQTIGGSDVLELRVVLEAVRRRHKGVGDDSRQLADALSLGFVQRQRLEGAATLSAHEQRTGNLATRLGVVDALLEAVHVVREPNRLARQHEERGQVRCFEDRAGNAGRALRQRGASDDDDGSSRNESDDQEPGDRRVAGSVHVSRSSHDAPLFAHETTVAGGRAPRVAP